MTTNIVATKQSISRLAAQLKSGEYPSSKNTQIPDRNDAATWTDQPPPLTIPPITTLPAEQWNDISTPWIASPSAEQKRAIDRQYRVHWRIGRADDEYSCEAVGKKISLPCISAITRSAALDIHGVAGTAAFNAMTSLILDRQLSQQAVLKTSSIDQGSSHYGRGVYQSGCTGHVAASCTNRSCANACEAHEQILQRRSRNETAHGDSLAMG